MFQQANHTSRKCCISYNGNSTDLGPLGGAYDRGGWAFWGWMCFLWVIHYGGWFLSFPSSVEERLWILSTVLMLLLVFFIYLIHLRLHYFPASRTANVLLRFIVFFIFPVVRVYSLVQILVLLRGLPRGLYCPISWTEYFPHFQWTGFILDTSSLLNSYLHFEKVFV